MGVPRSTRAFALLWREFIAQFFMTEVPASSHQLRQAMIGVLAFVVTPGFFLSLQLGGAFELASRQDPAVLEGLTRLLATIFLAYAMVVVGVIAAFEWDALAFDRRDALVVGPLPVSGRVVVAAKTAALAAILAVVVAGVNGLTAVTFSLAATSHQGFAVTGRLFMAHMVTTTAASVFVFCTLVSLRSVVGFLGRGRLVIGSLVQFALVSGLLCFLIFAPTAVKLEFPRRASAVQTIRVHIQPITIWSPTNWFAALYDELRGTALPAEAGQSRIGVELLAASVLAAVASIAGSYRQQLRISLAPARSQRSLAIANLPRVLARLLAGRRRAAKALADFMVTTLARSRAQQSRIAMNAALAVVMIALDAYRAPAGTDALRHLSAVSSPLPLIAAFWLAVGFRASFFVPSELPSAWAFRIGDAASAPGSRHAAMRGAMMATLVPCAAAAAAVVSARAPWPETARQTIFVALASVLLVELTALTVGFIPFTRPYEPGHARLKTRWPLYALGAYAFAYGLAALERSAGRSPLAFGGVLIVLAGLSAAIDVWGRARARTAPVETVDTLVSGSGEVTLLGITSTANRFQ